LCVINKHQTSCRPAGCETNPPKRQARSKGAEKAGRAVGAGGGGGGVGGGGGAGVGAAAGAAAGAGAAAAGGQAPAGKGEKKKKKSRLMRNLEKAAGRK
jgi:hypothetical protein